MIDLLYTALQGTINAAKEVERQYVEGFSVESKADNSPLTTADKAANAILLKYLTKTEIPILSEEGQVISQDKLNTLKTYWVIDPIDGTKEFVDKTGEYCVCTALMTDKTPILGILAAPTYGLFYFASENIGSYKYNLPFKTLYELEDESNLIDQLIKNSTKLIPKNNLKNYTFFSSKSHKNKATNDYFEKLENEHKKVEKIEMGSAIKFGLLAEGKANEYTRLSPLHYWDIAAGHAVAKYAGLQVLDYYTQQEVTYTNDNLKIENFSIINN